jgi:protein O-GlcNAc transferase
VLRCFRQAIDLAPDWQLPRMNLEVVARRVRQDPTPTRLPAASPDRAAERFLLIKAWGYGFWSDVAHVLGQLLIAELTRRTPIVYWGANSLFWDGTVANVFDAFFEPVSKWTLADVQDSKLSVWPPKWHRGNLTAPEVNKWKGPFSRLAGLYLLGRQEDVIVSDFFTYICDLKPWIPYDSRLHDMTVDELYAYLARKYLRPKPEITDAVNRFYAEHLRGGDFIAVHARGSDKILEVSNLEDLNRQYESALDALRAVHGTRRIFLLTDDSRLRAFYVARYGDSVLCTDCLRTSTSQGIHYQATRDRKQLGAEVMVDAYLATKAEAFLGNASSSVSLMVGHLKEWPSDCIRLIGPNAYHMSNMFLHDW